MSTTLGVTVRAADAVAVDAGVVELEATAGGPIVPNTVGVSPRELEPGCSVLESMGTALSRADFHDLELTPPALAAKKVLEPIL